MWIFLTILAVLLLLLSMPVTVTAAYEDELTVKLQYLFFRIGILPSPPKEETGEKPKKKKKAAPKDEKQPKRKKKISLDFVLEILELAKQALSSLRNPLGWFLRSICYRDIWLHVTVCQDDAHQTALRYGQVQAIFHSVFSLLRNCIDIQTTDVQINADFIGEEEKFAGGGKIKLRPINAIIFVFWFAGGFAVGYLKRKWQESQLQKELKKKQEK